MRELRRNQSCQANHSVRYVPSHVTRAFSLIELLITLVIVLIMVSIYWGHGSSSHQQQQKQNCQKNLQKIYVALQIYATEHDGNFPRVPGARTSEEALDVLIPRYTTDTSVFICPGSKDSPLPAGESIRKRRISYAYYMGRRITDPAGVLLSDRQLDEKPKKAGDPVFSATGKGPGSNHHKYGGNFLFCDARMESSPPEARFALNFSTNVVLLNPEP